MRALNFKRALPLLGCVGAVVAVYAVVGCPFRAVLGVSCPGCGMTRACISAARLNFGEAFHFHPLFPMAPLAVIVFMVRKKLPARAVKIASVTVAFALLAVYAYRLLTPLYGDVVYINVYKSAVYKVFTYVKDSL